MNATQYQSQTRVETSGSLRARAGGVDSAERSFAVWTHLSPLVAFFLIGPLSFFVPLGIWLARREQSSFNDDHGQEVMNMLLTGGVIFLIGCLTGIGMIAFVIWLIVTVINVIRGAAAASRDEYFRYPMIIRFL